jgi:Na+/H+ antiporter NhaD/arsenite permease-like protein
VYPVNFSKHAGLIWLDFFLSQILDNLTTVLVMCAVILAVGKDDKCFIGLGCINVVVAVNAGRAFSPFGDITTLMVWQKGLVSFTTFFLLFFCGVVWPWAYYPPSSTIFR